MSSEVGAYCSTFETMTIWHLKDMASNKRRRIKCTQVQIIDIPHFEGLEVGKLLMFAEAFNNGEVMEYLPSVKNEIL